MKDLLIVTTYFDYFGSKYMLPNFERFQAQVASEGVDLVVYEAAVEDQPFRLEPATNVLQLRSQHMLWQKERMVNLAIQRFGDEYRNIAWIDNDILFQDGWSQKLIAKLEKVPVVHLFNEIHYLLEDGTLEEKYVGYVKGLYDRNFEKVIDSSQYGCPGAAWAARMSAVRNTGIYDAYVNCGSDMMFAITVGGERSGWVIKMKRNPGGYNVLLNDRLNRHHGEWHREFVKELIRETGENNPRVWVDYLDHPAPHQYHGSLAERRYMERHWCLHDGGFDPATDIKLNEDGLFEWATDKPVMHKRLMKIFRHGKRFPAYT